MKTLKMILMLVLVVPMLSCKGQSNNNSAVSDNQSDIIEAYYFHFTARCSTCLTIESSAKENLATLYPNFFNQGLITFQSVNLDEESNNPLAERLGVTGQTLLLVKGNKQINITNEGFLYAVVKPEKFKEVIGEKVAELLSN